MLLGTEKNIRLICFIYKFGIYVDNDRHISLILVSFFMVWAICRFCSRSYPSLARFVSCSGCIFTRQSSNVISSAVSASCFMRFQYLFYLLPGHLGIKSNLNLIVSSTRSEVWQMGSSFLRASKLGYHFFILRRNLFSVNFFFFRDAETAWHLVVPREAKCYLSSNAA